MRKIKVTPSFPGALMLLAHNDTAVPHTHSS